MSKSHSKSRSGSRDRNHRRRRSASPPRPHERDEQGDLKRERDEGIESEPEREGRPRDEQLDRRDDARPKKKEHHRDQRERRERRKEERRRERAERVRRDEGRRRDEQVVPPAALPLPAVVPVAVQNRPGEREVFRVAPNFDARGRDLSGNMVTVFRFLDPARPGAYTHKMNPGHYRAQYRALTALSTKELAEGALQEHTSGESGTAFISVALNPNSVAMSGDDSDGGVQSIVKNAPRLESFDVPVEYVLPGFLDVSRSETELVVLLPPGDSLLNYRDRENSIDNPFVGLSTERVRGLIEERGGVTETILGRNGEVFERVVQQQAAQGETPQTLDFDQLPQNIREIVVARVTGNLGAESRGATRASVGEVAFRQRIDRFIQDPENAAEIRQAMG